ncbi:MAG TPA: GMP synthase (glutamine-hydrolyzing) [Chloroflexi bacterium]|jgi:GMP synthase (glutamine-hydrolysing)|nr:GMP synthase (glutamine-hydrolyzing) [Chloroflexota bacterium]HAL27898.1 GMP synthase (glutamine-hydrolyzing) [Chloroflexota bacterium]
MTRTGASSVNGSVGSGAASGLQRETIAVLDYGGQYVQLIARRVRESRVYCEIFPHDVTAAELSARGVIGVILSGGPASVYDADAPLIDPAILDGRFPVLGICYGMHLMAHVLPGGEVVAEGKREFGPATVAVQDRSGIFDGLGEAERAWMSHGDSVRTLPTGFHAVASTDRLAAAAMSDGSRRFGVQFHPEVAHTPHGAEILRNFVLHVCGAKGDWTPAAFVEESVAELTRVIGDRHAILALSGGVDSAVAAALVARAIGDRLTCVFIDTGMLREREAEQVIATFGPRLRLVPVDAETRFLARLAGVTDPERKRTIIGEEFIRCFEGEARRIGQIDLLVQGTIYPDVIESRAKDSKTSARIKTHHNVGGLPEVMSLEIVEPLRRLFKDEVRRVGAELGIPEDILWRHPFPGPGLAVRVIGELTKERLDILRRADAIFLEELRAADLYRTVAQAFAVLTPVQSVGVMGDYRTYGFLVALRAVTTEDFMTADWARLPYDVLARISARIVNEVSAVNRVVYDISSKPPATIEWE